MKNVELVRYDPQAFDEAEEDWGIRKLFGKISQSFTHFYILPFRRES